MIDLHCHILPGIDDGPGEFEESLAMARMAAADGITRIVATPHVRDGHGPAPATVRRLAGEMNRRLEEESISLRIVAGAEIYLLGDPAWLRPENLKDHAIGETNYLLVELPFGTMPRNSRDILFRIRGHGFFPLLGHPERNMEIVRNPDLLFELLDLPVHVQLTAESLTGGFGPEVQNCAAYLLESGVASVIATDGHSAVRRPPLLSAGLAAAARIIGKRQAGRLVLENPAAILANRPLPPV